MTRGGPVRHRTPGGAVRYTLTWLVGGGIAAILIIALIDAVGGAPSTVEVEPVREPSLASAAPAAGCRLLEPDDVRPSEPVSEGASGVTARPGVYEAPLARSAIVGSLRRGVVVIQHRPDLAADEVDELRALFDAVPEGTIVTANPRMRDAAAITAWRRALLCPHVAQSVLDAFQLFRGRFLGAGPDA